MQSKAIELTCLTQLAQYGKRFMALDSAWVQSKAIEPTHLSWVAQNAKRFMALGAIKAIELSRLTVAAQDTKCLMALGAIEGNRTHPFDKGSAGCQVLHGNRTHPFDEGSTGCTCSTLVVQDAKRYTAWRSIEGNRTQLGWNRMPSAAYQSTAIELTRSTRVAQDAKHFMALRAIELTRLTRVAQDAKRCTVWRSIEGNRTHPFDWGSAVCQAFHGHECNQGQSNSPVRLG